MRISPLALLATLLVASCVTTPPEPPPRPKPPARPPSAPVATPTAAPLDATTTEALLAPCLPETRTAANLQQRMTQAWDHRDPRCWTAAELALGELLLTADDPQLREAAHHFRQAELRANRHALDDLAALAHRGRAQVMMKTGDADAVVFHLERASRSVGLDAAATGHASEALDALLVLEVVERLAQWERTEDAAHYEVAAAAATRLKAREALRGFLGAGATVADLGRMAADEAADRLGELGSRSDGLPSLWGPPLRERAGDRLAAAEAVVENAALWVARSPLLLDWLPGELRQTASGAAAVMAEGEVFLDYSVGEKHGALLVVTATRRWAHPIPGRADLEAGAAACVERDDCRALTEALFGPAIAALADARQLLVAAHGPVHRVPFERLVPEGVRVYRVPSFVGLTGLRLRAWEGVPPARPEAASLPGAAAEETEEGWKVTLPDGPEALAALRAALAAGPIEVLWEVDGATRVYGAPLTVPAPAEPAKELPAATPAEAPPKPAD